MRNRTVMMSVICGAVLFLTACGSESPSFSILPDQENFQQSTESINTKIDILWVIDNSGSMSTSQAALAANFQSFIEDFQTKNFDFQMAVTTTDAYLADPNWTTFYNDYQSADPVNWAKAYDNKPQSDKSLFRDGYNGTYTGIPLMNQTTDPLATIFQTNVLVGIEGYGDERAFQSMVQSLEDPANSGLVRSNSFLAVIIVTDEDDFSHPGYWIDFSNRAFIGDNTNPALDSVQSYIDYLTNLTNSTESQKNFNVSSITIKDTDCQNSLNGTFTERIIADRVLALSSATGGKQGDLCGAFADELSDIADNIITNANIFFLDRLPIASTISVIVNGVEVPNIETSGSTEGFSYDESNNAIVFTPGAVPEQGASIAVRFDPQGLDG